MQFRPLQLDELDTYEHKVGAALKPEEFVSKDAYLERLKTKKIFESWVMFDPAQPDEWVGWCAVATPTTVCGDTTLHLYGGVIFEPYRGKGYSKLLYEYRIGMYPEYDKSVSVRPENILSMNIALSHGFKPVSYAEGFINLIRKTA